MDNPFKFLTKEEWREVMTHGEKRRFEPEEMLVTEGSKPQGLFVINSGQVGVYREPADGFRFLVAEQGPGAIFGEMSFIEAEPTDVSVAAITEVEALFITHAQLQAAIDKTPSLFGRFFQSLAWILSRRLRETTGRVGQKHTDWLGN